MQLYDTVKMKDYILSEFSQIDIFSIYLQIDRSEIEYCLSNTSNKTNNVLRGDENPSLGFMWVQDRETGLAKIRMYDFANSHYRGDCFDLVALTLQLQSNNKIAFITICKDIIYTLNSYKFGNQPNQIVKIPEKEVKKFDLTYRPWNTLDIDIWNGFGFHILEINRHIFPIQSAKLDDGIRKELIYFHSHNDPCYAYVIGFYKGIVLYKLYFPLRKKDGGLTRFMTNNRFYQLEDMHNLKPADLLLIAKSYKDKLLFKKILFTLKLPITIEVTNISSESIILRPSVVEGLNMLYFIIITNFDFDYQGLVTSGEHMRKYGFPRFMFTNGRYGTPNHGGKDLCEVRHNKGFNYVIPLIRQAFNTINLTLLKND
jgi:hypothetical protein